MRILKLACLVAALVSPTLSQAVGFGVGVRPAFRTTVTPLNDGTYEVAAIGTSAPVAYWCGIGDFAIRTLRTSATQRIYISKPYERGARTVQFSLSPPEGAEDVTTYSVTVKTVGANMTAGSAQGYCYDNFIDFGF
ncbi:hypothetical protein [Ruegeria conchae]|uniref:Secreted protein n=1 Tax=Ruegeria conchae TaxID=981384 RepID=A0A497Z2G4_9RHOB|nr:hypothetical protein [Ruegeria conchae]RLK02581.1 hypothetical protein CLV75_3131 [Ruegeria conchae]UWR03550.1 hypothetical protein K3740_02235 [Ruegeria conchae]